MYRWKGKIVTKKVYDKRIQSQESAKNLWKIRSGIDVMKIDGLDKCEVMHQPVEQIVTEENVEESFTESEVMNQPAEQIVSEENVEESAKNCVNRRIVEFETLAAEMWCCYCKEALSFQFIENEVRRGFGSILTIRCHKCLILNTIRTGKQHSGDITNANFNGRFDINTKAVLGVMHSGMGFSQLEKLFACMNIPCISERTYKKHEADVGKATENVAKDSCRKATAFERNLTLENRRDIEKSLPLNYQNNFIAPGISNNFLDTSDAVNVNDIVRIVASYDMGWSTRGSGRNYDSLNGFGALIGNQSGKVLDFDTCNRKCKKCDNNNSTTDHECRKNFYGSAKAMEPHVAAKLVANSSILKEQNLEVGVLIGDDDSSTIAACRQASQHDIIKQSDVNHTAGGVKKALYKEQRNHKDLSKNIITYLHRCFTYAMAQNKGNCKEMANAVRAIPHHAKNDHTLCGSWCNYHTDPENYDHSTIPGGIQNEALFEALKDLFYKLAENAEKFAAGASSNRNESLNATMASKAPKSRCYSLSASADFRFASSVAQKNVGEGYTEEVVKSLTLSPGVQHKKHVLRKNVILTRKRLLCKTPSFKRRRMRLKMERTALRHRRENGEGTTYQTGVALLTEPAVPSSKESENFEDLDEISNAHRNPIVLLDLETSGLHRTCEILQIAAKNRNSTFSVYVKPTEAISQTAIAIHGITSSYGQLFLRGKPVISISLKDALVALLEWLQSLNGKCCIAAHNLQFDGPRIMKAIMKHSLSQDFKEVIVGFADTVRIIREKTNRKACSISALCNDLNICNFGAHDAAMDCAILSTILKKLQISQEMILEDMKSFDQQVAHWIKLDETHANFLTLTPLKAYVGDSIRRKLAESGIVFLVLNREFVAKGRKGLINFLNKKLHQKLQSKSLMKICLYFEQNGTRE